MLGQAAPLSVSTMPTGDSEPVRCYKAMTTVPSALAECGSFTATAHGGVASSPELRQ